MPGGKCQYQHCNWYNKVIKKQSDRVETDASPMSPALLRMAKVVPSQQHCQIPEQICKGQNPQLRSLEVTQIKGENFYIYI